MEKVRFGLIGVGNMGSAHSPTLAAGKIEGAVLAAIADNRSRTDRKHPRGSFG